MSEEETIRLWQDVFDSKETVRKYRNAFAGDGAGTVDVSGEPGYIWCRYSADQSKVSKVFSMVRGIPEDFPIQIGRRSPDDEFEQVLWINWTQYQDIVSEDTVNNFNTSNHGESHNAASGADPAPIDLRNILEMRGRAQDVADLTIFVERTQYLYGDEVKRYPGETLDLTASVPGVVGHRYASVYVDGATNAAAVTDGTIVPIASAAPIPDPIANTIAVCLVDLENGQTTITEDDIFDWRRLWEIASFDGPVLTGTDAERLALTIADLAELTRFHTTDKDTTWEVWEGAWRLIYPPSELATSDGDLVRRWSTDATGILTGSKNLVLADGVSDSPLIVLRGGSNDDEIWQFLDDDPVAGHSDYVIGLADAAGDSEVKIKDSGGTTVFRITSDGDAYNLDDTDQEFRIATVADGITRTVGAGKDHTTIQAAVDFFKNRLIVGACKIDVDAGSYDEAVVFEDIFITSSARLELEGDTRVLAGKAFIDGAEMNSDSLANGGGGVCTLANAGSVITVTGAGTNPDFDADGWGNGDKLLVYDNTGTTTEYTISSTLNNAITLTVAAPNVGNDGTAIALTPNRRIQRTSAGKCIEINGLTGLLIDGFDLETSTGADCIGLSAENGSLVEIDNVLVRSEDEGIVSRQKYSRITFLSSASSVWNSTDGYFANQTAQLATSGVSAIDCSGSGFLSTNLGFVSGANGIATNCTYGFRARRLSLLSVANSWARVCTTGYYAQQAGYCYASTTNAKNTSTAAYNPAVSDTFGNNNGHITWT
jgi:hypothetical protein